MSVELQISFTVFER